jgi:hypothetical protein
MFLENECLLMPLIKLAHLLLDDQAFVIMSMEMVATMRMDCFSLQTQDTHMLLLVAK